MKLEDKRRLVEDLQRLSKQVAKIRRAFDALESRIMLPRRLKNTKRA